jgi:hypothetical protein
MDSVVSMAWFRRSDARKRTSRNSNQLPAQQQSRSVTVLSQYTVAVSLLTVYARDRPRTDFWIDSPLQTSARIFCGAGADML